jgi:hypothetical protein
MTKPRNMGVINIVCPTTMPVGVRNIPKKPNGPARENSTQTSKPTTTEGTLNSVWMTFINTLLPRKRRKCIKLPSGKQITEAKRQAIPEILKDSPAISITSGSRDIMSSRALVSACHISINCSYYSNMLFLGTGFVLAGAGNLVSALRAELPV